MTLKTNYANRTEELKEKMIKTFRQERKVHGRFAQPGHLTACVAHRVYELTDRQWNGKAGADAFASTLATLVMSGEIEINFKE